MKVKSSFSRFRRIRLGGESGFTLVETVIAMGIVSFAMLGILGLVPVGLSNFREAMSNTAESQIVQGLSNNILLTDYSLMSATYKNQTNISYYSDEGLLLAGPTDPAKAFEVSVSSTNLAPAILSAGNSNSVADDIAVGQTVKIEVRKIKSNQASRKYSFIVPKG